MYHKYVCVSTLAVHSHLLVRLLALTLRTPSYTYISPQVYIYPATRIYIYITNTFSCQPLLCTHTCLCPCERSHLETLCIHTYHHKYTCIISQIYHKYLCVKTLAVHSHLLVPLRALTLRNSLYTYISSQVHINQIANISQIPLRVNPRCALTLACALASTHTPNLVVFKQMLISIHTSFQKYITNTFAYQPLLCTHTCLCPCERSHLEPLRIHTYHHKYTYIPQHVYIYITNTFSCQPLLCTHTCLCPCERSHLETLCIHTYHHKYTCIISQIYHKYLCVKTLAVHSHLLVPLRALTLRNSLYTYISSQVHINQIANISQIPLRVNPRCALTLACALASTHTPNLVVFKQMLISIHTSFQKYITNTFAYQPLLCTHTCLCPCERSHLETLRIHTYHHKYTYIPQHVCASTLAMHSQLLVPLRGLTLWPPSQRALYWKESIKKRRFQ